MSRVFKHPLVNFACALINTTNAYRKEFTERSSMCFHMLHMRFFGPLGGG
jgi:hypothetical protein